MKKTDKLKCKMCLKIFYQTYQDWEKQTRPVCPHCFHNVAWNLSDMDKMSDGMRAWTEKHIYEKGSPRHLSYIKEIGKLVDLKVEDYI